MKFQDNFTPLSKIGEFQLIESLTKFFHTYQPTTIFGIGDDCAVQKVDEVRVLLTSTDLLVEGIHFDLTYCPPVHLGYKAAMVNFSDIIAMNAFPSAITVSIACSNYHSFELIQQIYQGIQIACDELQVDLIGGDTSSSRRDLVISVTVNGFENKDLIAYRSGAKHADLICVSGDLGSAFAGFQILERERRVHVENPEIQPDFLGFDYVLERQLRPRARYDIVRFFREYNIQPSSMIDISDGLANEINHVSKASKLGAVLISERIPSDYQTQIVSELMSIPLSSYQLYGGEDYEVLFTISPKFHDIIKKNKDISIIGYMTDEVSEPMLQQVNSSLVPLKPLGFQHFETL